MTTAHPATAGRILALVDAHRAGQAEHRAALAADNAARTMATARHLVRIAAAVRDAGDHGLATALETEATAGAVLIAVLTSDDQVSRTQVLDAVNEYQLGHRSVDARVHSTT